MDIGQIASAVSSLKVASDIAQGLMSLKTMAQVQAKAIELNQQLIAAQHRIFAANATQTTLVERVRELEGQIARMKDWEAQKQRYKLVAPFAGCMVYALQKSMSDGEPPHYLCTNCFKQGKPSILQNAFSTDARWTSFVCPVCKLNAPTGYRGPVPAKYAEDIPPA